MSRDYLDIDIKNTDNYESKTYPSNFQKGSEYKNTVINNLIYKELALFEGLNKHINKFINNEELAENTAKDILSRYGEPNLQNIFYNTLKNVLVEDKAKSLSFQYSSLLSKMNYDMQTKSYFSYIRDIFMIITECNIRKAIAIQGSNYHIDKTLLDDYYEKIDFTAILHKENEVSRDLMSGYIWILNTAILIISEYKFFWREINPDLQ